MALSGLPRPLHSRFEGATPTDAAGDALAPVAGEASHVSERGKQPGVRGVDDARRARGERPPRARRAARTRRRRHRSRRAAHRPPIGRRRPRSRSARRHGRPAPGRRRRGRRRGRRAQPKALFPPRPRARPRRAPSRRARCGRRAGSTGPCATALARRTSSTLSLRNRAALTQARGRGAYRGLIEMLPLLAPPPISCAGSAPRAPATESTQRIVGHVLALQSHLAARGRAELFRHGQRAGLPAALQHRADAARSHRAARSERGGASSRSCAGASSRRG